MTTLDSVRTAKALADAWEKGFEAGMNSAALLVAGLAPDTVTRLSSNPYESE